MDVTKIPFVEKVGVIKATNGGLELPFSESVHNHLQTIHASAQFALAETASGETLTTLFPELVGKVIPVLRDSQIKFRKPASSTISANSSITEESVVKFKEQLSKKGRALISVNVEIKDQDGIVTSKSIFNWFVQSIV